MRVLQDEGIILHNKSFFEKDRLVEVFLKSYGKVRFLYSRGSQMKSSYAGLLREFNCVSLNLQKGKSFYYLKSCQLSDGFSNLHSQYNALMLAYYFSDIVRSISVDEQPNIALYDCLKKGLIQLSQNQGSLQSIQQFFEKNILISEGLYDDTITDSLVFKQILMRYTGKPINDPQFIK
tara:strand:+ start:440 stop:973 length:534 start_codon:yes stop_codon:yes gene_type:complete